MKVRYEGPSDAVDIPDVGTVERGEVIEVPDEVGRSLCEQVGAWSSVEPKSKAKERDE